MGSAEEAVSHVADTWLISSDTKSKGDASGHPT